MNDNRSTYSRAFCLLLCILSLNPFWEEKGYVTAREYSRFCNTTVPLLRMGKMIYLNNEEFSAQAEISHYGQVPLENVTAGWKISDRKGRIMASGEFPVKKIATGLAPLGEIHYKLTDVIKPEQLMVSVYAGSFENSWDIWVYPSQLPPTDNEEQIMVTRSLDAAAMQFLNKGGKILLTVKKGSVVSDKGGNVPVGFSSIFWNTQWTAFKQPPFTLGILCNPAHLALSEFPTEFYSNWQWWDAMSHCNAIRLDSVSPQIRPIVRIIDDWFTARPLGMIFECKTANGKLLVSGVDLLSEQEKRPEARQLLYSLKKYMAGSGFDPDIRVEPDKIASLFE